MKLLLFPYSFMTELRLKWAMIDQFEQIVYMAPGKRGNEVTIFSLFLHDRAEAFPVSTQCKFS